uniref:Uncharacterized protein n=1 Tax=Faecalibaculum rodentium TaxID=1702221 RepID=A0A140DYE6_9FIRM|nr:hypothetical protein AALO17_25390 [Faecalibaculum rodentium]
MKQRFLILTLRALTAEQGIITLRNLYVMKSFTESTRPI